MRSLHEQLITLADARAMIVERVPAEQRRKHWQSASLKLMAAAQNGRADLIDAANKTDGACFASRRAPEDPAMSARAADAAPREQA